MKTLINYILKLRIVVMILFVTISSLFTAKISATSYCHYAITSSDATKTIYFTLSSLGNDTYQFKIESDEVMTGFSAGSNLWASTSSGNVYITSFLTLSGDGKTLSYSLTSTTKPGLYAGALYVLYPGEKSFTLPTADEDWSATCSSTIVPTLTTPTATTITNTSATLGATVTSNGGADLSARGTVYKTTTGVTITDNILAEGGTSVAAYSHSRTGFSPQTLYYYKGYATNSVGSALSAEGSFRTLSNPPTAQPATFTGTAGNAQVVLNWGTATYPATGATKAGYLVLYSTGTPSMQAAPNGLAPASAKNVGTIVNVTDTNLPTTPALTVTATGLTNGTLYNFLIVPYTWDGTNASTYNYYTTGAKTTSATPAIPPAPTPPARVATDVKSIYSDAYTSVGITNINPNWDQSTTVTQPTIGTPTLLYSNLNYQGCDYNATDVTSMEFLHVDIFPTTSATIQLVVMKALETETFYNFTGLTLNTWNSIDIPKASLGLVTPTGINQWKFVASASTIIYLDNIYFWKAPSAPVAPVLTTTAATAVSSTAGTMNGNISSNGGEDIIDYGFYWSPTANFANGTGTKVQLGTTNYTGNISSALTGLIYGTYIYYKAYAENSIGVSYGAQQTFFTGEQLSPFCETLIYHLGDPLQTASKVALTVEKISVNTIRVTLTEVVGGVSLATASPMKARVLGTGAPAGELTTAVISGGKMYIDFVFSPVPTTFTLDYVQWGAYVARQANYASFINMSFDASCTAPLINHNTIVWTNVGGDGDWDNYANWIDYSTLKALDNQAAFPDSLTVIIPAPTNSKYLAGSVTDNAGVIYPAKKTPSVVRYDASLYMKDIIIEYGAGLKINPLFGKYTNARVELEIADRNEWILIGPNVQPYENGVTPRSMLSYDYYLSGTPQVYMNEMVLSGVNNEIVSWSNSFPNLDKVISADKGFAIKIPDQYGKWKVSGRYYYRSDGAVSPTIGSEPVEYTFVGKFLNESTAPSISTISGKFVVACNTFTSNISATNFLTTYGGQIAVWSFNETSLGTAQPGSFTTYNLGTVPADLYIKPMHAFMYLDAGADRVINLDEDVLCNVNTSTKYRARAFVERKPTLGIIASTGAYSSKMSIVYDENLSDASFNLSKDLLKVFSGYEQTPEVFSYLGSKTLQSQTMNDLNSTIPLGIRTAIADTVKLVITGANEFEGVSLVDKQTGVTYDLTGDTTKINLDVLNGTNSDRLYIKFAAPVPQLETNIKDNKAEISLKIYTEDNQHVIVSNAENTKVNEIFVIHISGRTTSILPKNETYNVIDMSSYAPGVYAVKAVTDTESKTVKIVIK